MSMKDQDTEIEEHAEAAVGGSIRELDAADIESLHQLYPPSKFGRQRTRTEDSFRGIRFKLKNGCTWRAIPKDVVPHQTAYKVYCELKKSPNWEIIQEILVAD